MHYGLHQRTIRSRTGSAGNVYHSVTLPQALSSFCPSSGRVKQVDVYLSEFGKERLADEDRLGPEELRGQPDQQDDDDYTDLAKSRRKVTNLIHHQKSDKIFGCLYLPYSLPVFS